MKRRRAVLATLGVLLAGAIAASLILRPGDGYPTTREGWAARWEAVATEFGRSPGENWDVWLEVKSEIEAAPTDAERVGAALDRLEGIQITPPISDTIGTEHAIDDYFPFVTIVRETLTGVVLPNLRDALSREDLHAAQAWWDRGLSLCRVVEARGCIIGQVLHDGSVLFLLRELNTFLTKPGPIDSEWVSGRIDSMDLTADLAWFITTEREFGLGVVKDQRASMGAKGMLVAADEARVYEHAMDLWREAHQGDNPAAAAKLLSLQTRIESDSLFARRRPNLAMAVPFTGGSARTRRSVLTQVDGLRLLLALRQYHARTGVYPLSLADLKPIELPDLPSDPHAPDGAYRYKLLDQTSSDPRLAFVLYSVGADGVDDGGQKSLTAPGDELRLPGGDHVFNQPVPQLESTSEPGGTDQKEDQP